ncbi:MAG: hypothetical protein ACREJU_06340, partial [Nitrospiraceae bacterium]
CLSRPRDISFRPQPFAKIGQGINGCLLEDKDLMAALRKGVADVEAGRGIPWEKAKSRLGL